MKKFFAIVFSLVFICLAVTGCGKKIATETEPETESGTQQESTEGFAGMPNPMVSFDTLDEINKKTGVNLVKPGTMGVSDEAFFVVNNTLADYRFKVGGYEYTFRASKNLGEEISGIYIDGKLAFDGEKADYSFKTDETYKAIRFLVNNIQYVLSVADNGSIADMDFDAMAVELKNTIMQTTSDSEYVALAGDYQDSYSQRATAQVALGDTNLLHIQITWGSSADETDLWDVSGKIKDGKIVYDKESIFHYRYSDGSYKELTDTAEGYFEITDKGFNWSGSGDESTQNCAFEK